MGKNRCVTIDGALVRVSGKFDATEGSADMEAMREILAAARRKYFAETPDPISVANAEQSRRLQAMGDRNDREDVTAGSGIPAADYAEEYTYTPEDCTEPHHPGFPCHLCGADS